MICLDWMKSVMSIYKSFKENKQTKQEMLNFSLFHPKCDLALLSSISFVLNGVFVANGFSPDRYELTEPQIKQTFKQTMLI